MAKTDLTNSRMRFAMHVQSSSWEGYLGRQFTDAVHAVNTLDELGYQVRARIADNGTVTPWDADLSFTSPDALAEHFAAMEDVKVIHPGGWTFPGTPIAPTATVKVTEAGASAAYWMAETILDRMRKDGTLKDLLQSENVAASDDLIARTSKAAVSEDGLKARVTTQESVTADLSKSHVHLGAARVFVGDDKGGFAELKGVESATFDPEQVQAAADRVQAARGRIAEAHGKDVAELLVDGGHDPFQGDPVDADAMRVTWRVGEPFTSPSFPRRRLVESRREAIQYALKLVGAGAEGVTIHDAKLTTEFRTVKDDPSESAADRERRRIEQLRRTLNDECDCPGCTARRQREADGKRFIRLGDGKGWPFTIEGGNAIFNGKLELAEAGELEEGLRFREAVERAKASGAWQFFNLEREPTWWDRVQVANAAGWEGFKARLRSPVTVGDVAVWSVIFIVATGVVRALT